jgi:hypothetical protein
MDDALHDEAPELILKCRSMRPKDQGDLYFLRELFAAEGRQPPE